MDLRDPLIEASVLRVGQRVEYRGSWGTGPARPGFIISSGTECGRPVFDVLLDNGKKHWGYPEQFDVIGEVA